MTTWTEITDPRDDAILSPSGQPRYEIADQQDLEDEMGELSESDVRPLPAGCTHLWTSGRRWLCD